MHGTVDLHVRFDWRTPAVSSGFSESVRRVLSNTARVYRLRSLPETSGPVVTAWVCPRCDSDHGGQAIAEHRSEVSGTGKGLFPGGSPIMSERSILLGVSSASAGAGKASIFASIPLDRAILERLRERARCFRAREAYPELHETCELLVLPRWFQPDLAEIENAERQRDGLSQPPCQRGSTSRRSRQRTASDPA